MAIRNPHPPASLSKAELKHLKALSTKKGREVAGLFLLDGWKPVAEALASPWQIESVVVDPGRIPASGASVLQECVRRGVGVRHGTSSDLRSLSDVVHDQGIVAVVRSRRFALDDLPSVGDLIVLDAVADPGNVGSLIRTADWFGMSGVVLGPGCSSVNNEKVVRATMGSLFHLPVVEVDDLSVACSTLDRKGVILAGAEVAGGGWRSWVPEARIALVLGSESHGISAGVRALLKIRVSIPKAGRAESLNVAGAGAVLLSSIAEHRKAGLHATS
ncbi:MAG: RNA methyltransferase [Bacteroidota bacterium]